MHNGSGSPRLLILLGVALTVLGVLPAWGTPAGSKERKSKESFDTSYPHYSVQTETGLRDVIRRGRARLNNSNRSRRRTLRTKKLLGIAHHELGAEFPNKNSSYHVQKSIEYLKEVRDHWKNDPEVVAFLGSAYTLVARNSYNPVTKLQYVYTGTELLDEAVNQHPRSIPARVVRLFNSRALPAFLNRVGYVRTDLEYLTEQYGAQQEYEFPSLWSSVLFLQAKRLENRGRWKKARHYYQESMKAFPEGKTANKAEQKYQKLINREGSTNADQ